MPFGDAAAPVRHGAVAGTQTVSLRPARGIQTLSPQAIEDFAQGTGGLLIHADEFLASSPGREST